MTRQAAEKPHDFDPEDDEWRAELAKEFHEASYTMVKKAQDAAEKGEGRLARDLMVAAGVSSDKVLLLLGRKRGTSRVNISQEEMKRELADMKQKAEQKRATKAG